MSLSPETTTIYDPEQYSEDELRAYQAQVLAEIASELEAGDHLAQAGVEVVCFTSFQLVGDAGDALPEKSSSLNLPALFISLIAKGILLTEELILMLRKFLPIMEKTGTIPMISTLTPSLVPYLPARGYNHPK